MAQYLKDNFEKGVRNEYKACLGHALLLFCTKGMLNCLGEGELTPRGRASRSASYSGIQLKRKHAISIQAFGLRDRTHANEVPAMRFVGDVCY